MKTPSTHSAGPLDPSAPLLDPVPYRLDESDDIMSVIRELVDGSHPGIFTTVDAEGYPQARWMSTLSCTDFPYLYTLTAPSSRKVQHVEQSGKAGWMFFNRDLSLVVNLFGTADVLRDGKSLKEVWNQIRDKKHAYFLKNCTEGPGCVVIRTHILRAECTTPQNYMHFNVAPEEVMPESPVDEPKGGPRKRSRQE